MNLFGRNFVGYLWVWAEDVLFGEAGRTFLEAWELFWSSLRSLRTFECQCVLLFTTLLRRRVTELSNLCGLAQVRAVKKNRCAASCVFARLMLLMNNFAAFDSICSIFLHIELWIIHNVYWECKAWSMMALRRELPPWKRWCARSTYYLLYRTISRGLQRSPAIRYLTLDWNIALMVFIFAAVVSLDSRCDRCSTCKARSCKPDSVFSKLEWSLAMCYCYLNVYLWVFFPFSIVLAGFPDVFSFKGCLHYQAPWPGLSLDDHVWSWDAGDGKDAWLPQVTLLHDILETADFHLKATHTLDNQSFSAEYTCQALL